MTKKVISLEGGCCVCGSAVLAAGILTETKGVSLFYVWFLLPMIP